jgi:hypothetical protein
MAAAIVQHPSDILSPPHMCCYWCYWCTAGILSPPHTCCYWLLVYCRQRRTKELMAAAVGHVLPSDSLSHPHTFFSHLSSCLLVYSGVICNVVCRERRTKELMAAATKAVRQRCRPTNASLTFHFMACSAVFWCGLQGAPHQGVDGCSHQGSAAAPPPRTGHPGDGQRSDGHLCLGGGAAQGGRSLHPGVQLQVGLVCMQGAQVVAVLRCLESVEPGVGGGARSAQAHGAPWHTTAGGFGAPARAAGGAVVAVLCCWESVVLGVCGVCACYGAPCALHMFISTSSQLRHARLLLLPLQEWSSGVHQLCQAAPGLRRLVQQGEAGAALMCLLLHLHYVLAQ